MLVFSFKKYKCGYTIHLKLHQILYAYVRTKPRFYQAYLLIYVAFFILDDVLVLLFALKNKKLKALGQKHKKKIQMVSSLMLIVLALILLYDPALLSF